MKVGTFEISHECKVELVHVNKLKQVNSHERQVSVHHVKVGILNDSHECMV